MSRPREQLDATTLDPWPASWRSGRQRRALAAIPVGYLSARRRIAWGRVLLVVALLVAIVVALAGCCSVSRGYLRADVAEYRAWSLLWQRHGGTFAPEEQRLVGQNLASWRARLLQAGADDAELRFAPPAGERP